MPSPVARAWWCAPTAAATRDTRFRPRKAYSKCTWFHPAFFRRNHCVIGAGVVIDPIQLASELADLRERGVDTSALVISDRAHVVLPFHSEIDRGEERLRGEAPIGTTLRGIGPAYADKVSRRGMRMADLCDERAVTPRLERDFDARNRLLESYYGSEPVDAESTTHQLLEAAEILFPFVGHAEEVVQDALDPGMRVIVECAQGAMLDIDYGSYPFVTSSSPTAAGACQGAGIAPNQIERVIGVFKAYSSRVGSGPFPTELFDETGNQIRERGTNMAPPPAALDASDGSMRSPPAALRGSMA